MHVRAHRHARTLPNTEALGPEIAEGAVNRSTDPSLAFPRTGIGLVRIWQINSPYHTNVSKSIRSSSVYTQIPLAVKVALAIFPGKYNLPGRAETPFGMGYGAIMDTSKALDRAEAFYFQYIIDIMC